MEVITLALPGVCTSMDWDKDGDTLAIAHDYNGTVYYSTGTIYSTGTVYSTD